MEFAKTTAKNKGGIMATGFKETIKFNRKTIVSENSYGLVDQAKNVVMEANVSVCKNTDNEWQGSCEAYVIEPENIGDWYMDCWIGFDGIKASDYDGTSGYLPDEVLDLIDKHGFNTEWIRPDDKIGD